MSKAKHYVPSDSQTLTPQLVVKDAKKTIQFLVETFGAEKLAEYPGPDGKSVMWAAVKIGESRILLADASPFAKATTANIFLYVPDVDATVAKAKDRGASELSPPVDMFWGDRWALVADADGNHWQIATHLEDLTPAEIGERMKKLAAAKQTAQA